MVHCVGAKQHQCKQHANSVMKSLDIIHSIYLPPFTAQNVNRIASLTTESRPFCS